METGILQGKFSRSRAVGKRMSVSFKPAEIVKVYTEEPKEIHGWVGVMSCMFDST